MLEIFLNSIATLIVMFPCVMMWFGIRELPFGELASWMVAIWWTIPVVFVIWRIWA